MGFIQPILDLHLHLTASIRNIYFHQAGWDSFNRHLTRNKYQLPTLPTLGVPSRLRWAARSPLSAVPLSTGTRSSSSRTACGVPPGGRHPRWGAPGTARPVAGQRSRRETSREQFLQGEAVSVSALQYKAKEENTREGERLGRLLTGKMPNEEERGQPSWEAFVPTSLVSPHV
jgi:hypothetical protein